MAAKEKEVKSLLIDVKKSSRCNSHSALVCLIVLLVAVIVCMAVFILTGNSQSSNSSSTKVTRDVSSVESELWELLNGQDFEKLLNERVNEIINGTIMAGPPGMCVLIS